MPLAGQARRGAALLIRPFSRFASGVLAPRASVHAYAPGVMYRQVDGGRHWVMYDNAAGAADSRLTTDPLWQRIAARAPVEVWANADGLIERLSHAVIPTVGGARRVAVAARLAHWTTTELSEHRAHEPLELPPAELVVRPPAVRRR